MSYCDCERDGREAFRRERYSYETSQRLERGRYFGTECDREFAYGFERERWREADERRDAEEREKRRQSAARAERRDAELQEDYERWQQFEQDERDAN